MRISYFLEFSSFSKHFFKLSIQYEHKKYLPKQSVQAFKNFHKASKHFFASHEVAISAPYQKQFEDFPRQASEQTKVSPPNQPRRSPPMISHNAGNKFTQTFDLHPKLALN